MYEDDRNGYQNGCQASGQNDDRDHSRENWNGQDRNEENRQASGQTSGWERTPMAGADRDGSQAEDRTSGAAGSWTAGPAESRDPGAGGSRTSGTDGAWTAPADGSGTRGQDGREQSRHAEEPWSTASDPARQRRYDDDWNHRNMSHIPQDREPKRRRKSSLGLKIAGIAAAALLFGLIGGGAMFAVNTVGELVKESHTQETEAAPKVTVAQAETQGAADGSSGSAASADVTPAMVLDVSGIVKEAMPSVVAITNTMLIQQRTWFGGVETYEIPGSGSGIIVGQNDDELLIVTNNHVVEGASELTVTFIDEENVKAAVKGTDSATDLAVIAVSLSDIPAETLDQIKVATLGDSDALQVGQGVVAIGNALGYGQSVTVGYVSAKDRTVKSEDGTSRDLLQTDAAINPGNSGGALLNMNGEVIGINAAKYSDTDVEGMGYAIPVSQVADIINELMNKRTRVEVDEAKQGYLGIQGLNIDDMASAMYDMPRGIYVYKIVEGGAASKSDLMEKDIITKFDGQSVRSMEELKEMLTYYEGGDVVDLTVETVENGEYVERTVTVTLGTKADAEETS